MSERDVIRVIADYRRLRAILHEVFNGIERARREFGDDLIVQNAKLEIVADTLAESERITNYLKELQSKVLLTNRTG